MPVPLQCGPIKWATGAISYRPFFRWMERRSLFVSGATPRARFNVLTWVAGQGSVGAPAIPGTGGSAVTSLDYTNITNAGCTATGAGDSNSSPYIDYKNNAAYVGADNGKLYRIKNVFTGTPVVDYCITVAANAALTSPVYDSFSKKVFVSDGQRVYSFTPGATSFTAGASVQVAGTAGSIILSPMVDGFNGWVYVFSRVTLRTRDLLFHRCQSVSHRMSTPRLDRCSPGNTFSTATSTTSITTMVPQRGLSMRVARRQQPARNLRCIPYHSPQME